MRTVLFALFIASAAVAPFAAGQISPVPQMKGSTLWAAISVSRAVYHPDTITTDRFTMSFGLVNDGTKTVETGTSESFLVVNGTPLRSHEWWMAINNGLRDGGWERLPPGESTGVHLSVEKFFQEPGVYRVSWRGKNFQSPEIVFRVMPSKQK
jgi:hypothetical protein